MEGFASFVFGQKLKTQNKLICWNREEYGRVERRKKICLNKIMELELKSQTSSIAKGDSSAWEEAKAKNKRLLKMEEIS